MVVYLFLLNWSLESFVFFFYCTEYIWTPQRHCEATSVNFPHVPHVSIVPDCWQDGASSHENNFNYKHRKKIYDLFTFVYVCWLFPNVCVTLRLV